MCWSYKVIFLQHVWCFQLRDSSCLLLVFHPSENCVGSLVSGTTLIIVQYWKACQIKCFLKFIGYFYFLVSLSLWYSLERMQLPLSAIRPSFLPKKLLVTYKPEKLHTRIHQHYHQLGTWKQEPINNDEKQNGSQNLTLSIIWCNWSGLSLIWIG